MKVSLVYSYFVLIFFNINVFVFSARQMMSTVNYEQAHGAEGYVRQSVLDDRNIQRNVLYKLHENDP